MTPTLHQLWIGSLPEKMQPWVDSMRRFAAALGMDYRLDDLAALHARYADSPAFATLAAAWRCLPIGTTASLISDWYRLRILADEGGVYADTDFHFSGPVPAWRPSADLAFFNEHTYDDQLASGLAWCNGQRGQAAARFLVEAVEHRLAAALGSPDSPDFDSRYIATVRLDKDGEHGFSLLISPRYVREFLFPGLAANGFSVEPIPRDLAANYATRHHLKTQPPSLWHYGTALWRVDSGWEDAAIAARARAATPAWGIHQIWLGGPLPEKMVPWVESMKRLAEAMGWFHHLWTQDELEARYADSPAMAVFRGAVGVIPDCTRYGLASDWFRYALMADFGGIYADTDMQAQDIPSLAAFVPSSDIVFSNEHPTGAYACNGLIWCKGERGQKAARVLFETATRRLLYVLPPNAPDFAVRLVEIARQDKCVSGIARFGIGPVPLRKFFIPAMRAAGFSCGPVQRPVEADRRFLPSAWMVHNSAAAWYDKKADWEGMARAAAGHDLDRNDAAALEAAFEAEQAPATAAARAKEARVAAVRASIARKEAEFAANLPSLPPHLRPQGRTVLRMPRKTLPEPVQPFAEPVPDAVRALLTVPRGTTRILVFSNVTKGFPQVELKPGDFCVHINRAKHYAETIDSPRTNHALLVRHGLTRDRRVMWFHPDVFTGISQVVYLRNGNPLEQLPWWSAYRTANPRKCPTSGFIAANLMRDLAPDLPLLLVGFDPATPHGTIMWRGHAWQYEAQWYADHHFHIIKPT